VKVKGKYLIYPLSFDYALPSKEHQYLTAFELIGNFIVQKIRIYLSRSKIKVRCCQNLAAYWIHVLADLHQFLITRFSVLHRQTDTDRRCYKQYLLCTGNQFLLSL